MKILETYNTILKEAEIEACVKKFGYELFGDELGGKEKNTGIENKYLDDIRDFTDNKYGQEIDPDFVKAIKTLKSCAQQYPEILIPDKTKVYRGLTIPIKTFVEKKTFIDLNKPFPYTYTAKSKIQSWSTNFDAASIFGNHDMLNEYAATLNIADYQTPEARKKLLGDVIDNNLRAAFVLEYQTNSSEFIFKANYFRILSRAYHEDEVIRLTNKPINVLAKFNDHTDVFLTYKSIQLIRIINKAISEL